MNNVNESVQDLAKLIGEGKLMEGFEKYYGETISMQENEEEPRLGKEVNRAAEEAFVGGITKINTIAILGIAVGENYSTIESHLDVEHSAYGRINRKQVAVQTWEDGKIVKEKFYYDSAAK